MRKTFFDYYGKYAAETPDKVLLRIDENTLTYREFMEMTARLGSGMQKLGSEQQLQSAETEPAYPRMDKLFQNREHEGIM